MWNDWSKDYGTAYRADGYLEVCSGILIKGESMEKKIGIAMNNEVTWHMVVFAVLTIASVLGVLYSVFYLLFLR